MQDEARSADGSTTTAEEEALARVRRLAASWASLSSTSTLPADQVTAHAGRAILDLLHEEPSGGSPGAKLTVIGERARSWIEPGGSFTYPVAGQLILNAIAGKTADMHVTAANLPDSGTGEPRDWHQLRGAAIAAVCRAKARKTADIVDAVLGVLGEEAVNRMAAQLLEDTRIRSMDFRNGASLDLEPSRELVALWVGAARGMLGDAPNYSETEVELGRADPPGIEMTVGLASDPERFVFRLQRAGRLTPHQARLQAEQRAAGAQQQLAAAQAELAQLRAGQATSGQE